MTDVIEHRTLREHFPALIEAARSVGSVQIRNRATLAGNLCNASPAADTAPPLLAYGASLNLASADGTRQMPLDDFFTGPGERCWRRRARRVDRPAASSRAHGRRVRTAHAAAWRRSRDRQRLLCRSTNPARRVWHSAPSGRARSSSRRRRMRRLDDVWKHASPISDLRASADYRRAMLPVLARRALSDGHRADARGIAKRA